MKKTEYLYGIQPSNLDNMDYWLALEFKLKMAIKLFKDLYVEGTDSERIFYVNKAIEHTRGLLNEREQEQ